MVWLGTREDGTSRIVALLQLDRVGVLAPLCRDPTLMSLVAVRWGTRGQPDLSDKVVFEISNVLPLLEPYHLGRGEVDRRGLVFEVKAWTLLQLRNKCVQPPGGIRQTVSTRFANIHCPAAVVLNVPRAIAKELVSGGVTCFPAPDTLCSALEVPIPGEAALSHDVEAPTEIDASSDDGRLVEVLLPVALAGGEASPQ